MPRTSTPRHAVVWVRGVAVESERGERPAVQKEEEKNNFAQSEIIFTLR